MTGSNNTARVVLCVRPVTGPETFPEIELAGNRAGLEWLAERLLAVAHADRELHTHLDSEAAGPIYQSPGGWWLTIGRVDRLGESRPA